jgi:hypothetical protein
MRVLPSPSVHSLVSKLYSPYSSPILMHLGLKVKVCVVCVVSCEWVKYAHRGSAANVSCVVPHCQECEN